MMTRNTYVIHVDTILKKVNMILMNLIHMREKMGLNEDSNPNASQGKNKLTNRTTVMDMLDVISHKEFRKDYEKLSDSQKLKVLKIETTKIYY